MLIFFYRFICGYLYVKIVSDNPEKILNLCAARGISVWHIIYKNNALYFKISIKSFLILRKLKRNINGKIHIVKKSGFPFFVKHYKKRYALIPGIALYFLIIYILSSFVWNICINGNTQIESEKIYSTLAEIGVYEGCNLKNVNLKDIRNELLLKMKDLSWAALNLEGSVLTVDVSETKYEEKEENSPSNLKAAYDGVIKKTEVISGTLKVRAGDAVSKGDLLVSGFVEYNDGANLPVVSKGKIFAEVDTEIVVEQPLKITENVKTGKIKKRSVLNFFGLKIPLYLGTVKGSFEIERENKTFGENYSPVSITTAVFYMTEEKERTLENAELTKMLNISAEKRLESNLGDCEVLSKKEKIYYEENKAILKQKLTVLKDISYTEKLLLDIENQK